LGTFEAVLVQPGRSDNKSVNCKGHEKVMRCDTIQTKMQGCNVVVRLKTLSCGSRYAAVMIADFSH